MMIARHARTADVFTAAARWALSYPPPPDARMFQPPARPAEDREDTDSRGREVERSREHDRERLVGAVGDDPGDQRHPAAERDENQREAPQPVQDDRSPRRGRRLLRVVALPVVLGRVVPLVVDHRLQLAAHR